MTSTNQWTIALAGAVALTLPALAGCGGGGGDGQVVRATTPVASAQVAGGPLPPSATSPSRHSTELPSDSQIKAAQSRPIKPQRGEADASLGAALVAARKQRVEPGSTTAPAAAIALAERATRQWLVYEISGKAPDPQVIPHRVWNGVPPASPDERVKGAPLMSMFRAFSAHPEDGGWVVVVATADPRLLTLTVTLDGSASDPKVTEVTG